MTRQYASYSLNIPVSCHVSRVSDSTDLVILLHGFRESGMHMAQRALGDDGGGVLRCSVLAPNGPFPTPFKDKASKRWHEAYSWYFLNPERAGLQVPPAPSVEYLRRLAADLGFEHHRKVLVGFSQGAFLAPLLAPALKNVVRIVSVGGGFRFSDYRGCDVAVVDAIHGADDDVVPLAESQRGFGELAQLGKTGAFHVVPGLGHDLNDEGRGVLRRLLAEALQWR